MVRARPSFPPGDHLTGACDVHLPFRFEPRFDTPTPVQAREHPAPEAATIFVGGSRSIEHIPDVVVPRLARMVQHGHEVIVGDAPGIDQAIQTHLAAARYAKVAVFCSGSRPRNNVGAWQVSRINATGAPNGFQFHAAKDRAMADRAGFGLMIWDGRSPGTVLNVVRLVRRDGAPCSSTSRTGR